ncbi:MAG: hypothetical protein NTX64_12395 [Elusimicrobia bacterium]|nr:hypothetical protein [Elusimicrobiota bacterium]
MPINLAGIDVPHVLACLPIGEERPASLLEAAARLVAGLNARLSVVHVYPLGMIDARRQEAHRALAAEHTTSSWHLRSADPVPCLRAFARRHRVTHLLLGRQS